MVERLAIHPTSTTTCGCGDSSLFTWFIEWPAYAISHGLNPFYLDGHARTPAGSTCWPTPAILAIGVLLAPVTWLFGPVATLNVALTLAPALSALSMYVLLRRWVTWSPAAFVGGLFYGFSPMILVSLGDAHLMLADGRSPRSSSPAWTSCSSGNAAVRCHRDRPRAAGGAAVLHRHRSTGDHGGHGGRGGRHRGRVGGMAATPRTLRGHARYAVVGMASGSAVALVLLAGPAWFALSGPAHFGSTIWPGIYGHIARKQRTVLNEFFYRWSALNSAVATLHDRVLGGYQGRVLSYQYFGTFMTAVLIGGTAIWRRDRRLWFFWTVILISALLSFGARKGTWFPWRALENLPILENVEPYRFVLITDLAVAVMLGLIIEHIYVAVNRKRAASPAAAGPTASGLWSRRPRWAGAIAAAAVAVFALVQPVSYLARTIPMTTAPVDLPSWFTTVAPGLPGHQVPPHPARTLHLVRQLHDLAGRGPYELLHGGGRRPRWDSGAGRQGAARRHCPRRRHPRPPVPPGPSPHRSGRGPPGHPGLGRHHGGHPGPTGPSHVRPDLLGHLGRGLDHRSHRTATRASVGRLGVARGQGHPSRRVGRHADARPVHDRCQLPRCPGRPSGNGLCARHSRDIPFKLKRGSPSYPRVTPSHGRHRTGRWPTPARGSPTSSACCG